MKPALLIPLAALMFAVHADAQTRIWRCGNTYTNNESQAKGCKLVEGGNVTVVEGTRVSSSGSQGGSAGVKVASAPPSSSSSPAPARIDSGEQRARDGEARSILEAELKKAEARHAELLKEYNGGEPEKQGPEHRNHQKYVERVAELKASIGRTENDIAGLKRELARVGGTVPAAK